MTDNFSSSEPDNYLDLTNSRCPLTILKLKQAMVNTSGCLKVKINAIEVVNEIYDFCKLANFCIANNQKICNIYYLSIKKNKEL